MYSCWGGAFEVDQGRLGSPCCVGLLWLEDSLPGDFNLLLALPMMSKESFAFGYPIINLHMQGQGSAWSQLLPVPSLGLCPSTLVILQVELCLCDMEDSRSVFVVQISCFRMCWMSCLQVCNQSAGARGGLDALHAF